MVLPTTDTTSPEQKRRSPLRTLMRKPIALAAGIVAAVIVVLVYAAAWIAPYDPLQQDLDDILALPSASHWLGTDSLGRDILSRLLWGGQPTLAATAIALVVFAVTGILLGVLAGYLGGRVDKTISAATDVMLSVPGIVMLLAILAIFSRNMGIAMAVLGFLAAANLARIIRASCLSLREEPFVEAAKVSGLTSIRIMSRHIFPALVGPLLVQLSLFAGIALTVQTGLGFLGLATPAPLPSWGGMVGEAAQVIDQAGFFLLVTGGTIAIMTIAFGLVGDGLRDLSAERTGSLASARVPRQRAHAATAAPVDAPAGSVLSVRDYTVAFVTDTGATEIVHSIDFDVTQSEIFGIVGESGSGKTVTALSILGLLGPTGHVTKGMAWLGGEPISHLDPKSLRRIRGRKIGLVSQEPMVAFDPNFTIGSQLTEVIRQLTPLKGRSARARALELLTQVRLRDPGHTMTQYPHQLSGGMLQRCAIAMALAGSPDLLIADEPTTALDVTVQAGILDLLRDLREREGMAVILVTHDLGVVADICDRVIVMSQGVIVEQAEVDDLFARPQHEYTRTLIGNTPNVTSDD